RRVQEGHALPVRRDRTACLRLLRLHALGVPQGRSAPAAHVACPGPPRPPHQEVAPAHWRPGVLPKRWARVPRRDLRRPQPHLARTTTRRAGHEGPDLAPPRLLRPDPLTPLPRTSQNT